MSGWRRLLVNAGFGGLYFWLAVAWVGAIQVFGNVWQDVGWFVRAGLLLVVTFGWLVLWIGFDALGHCRRSIVNRPANRERVEMVDPANGQVLTQLRVDDKAKDRRRVGLAVLRGGPGSGREFGMVVVNHRPVAELWYPCADDDCGSLSLYQYTHLSIEADGATRFVYRYSRHSAPNPNRLFAGIAQHIPNTPKGHKP